MRGLVDLDGGFVAIDLHRFFGIDLTDELLEARSWGWLTARAGALLSITDSLTWKEAHRGI